MPSKSEKYSESKFLKNDPIPYLERIKTYYLALGYGQPYSWSYFEDVPFTPLKKSLSESKVTLITTAAPYQLDKGDQGPGAPYNALAKFYKVYGIDSSIDPDLRISHLAIDRQHTTAQDQESYFPFRAIRESKNNGRIAELPTHFYGLPTNRSQRVTSEVDCPDLLKRCLVDCVDVAILIPNCPVCHQSVSLAARLLEANGISTVIMGCAKDIVEFIGVPRLLFSDFPLGNGAGRPDDRLSQEHTLELAFCLLESATEPRTTSLSTLTWSTTNDWKLDYSNIDQLSQEEISKRRAEFDKAKIQAKNIRDSSIT